MPKILVTGASGQIGSELVSALRSNYGDDNVIITVHRTEPPKELKDSGPFVQLDAVDKAGLKAVIERYNIDTVYHLVGILSASGEKNPNLAWEVNMVSLKNILDLAVELKLKQIFWPSSIAAFGPTTPRDQTPQKTIMEPTTMYGVTKVAGELLCQYYCKKYSLDIRSLRYPGIISWKTEPGGGTTDYAVAIFYEALKQKRYECFVREDTVLPMMYMDDAVRATLQLMQAPADKIKIRTSYNLTALSFTAGELAAAVKKRIPDLVCTYTPDSRQNIADSWPKSIDDSQARKDWGWQPEYDLEKMVEVMLEKLREKLSLK